MISQRLRGMSEDGESVAGLIPKIQEAFNKYTDGAVSIIDKQNGGLNDTYTILEQLSKVYPTLSEEARAYLNEAIAGNRQNKVLVAIMENWGNVEDAVVSATNSTGSAIKENEKYLASISGKISQFKSETQQMWANAIDTNVVKSFVDLGTSIIKIVDGFGLLNTAIVVATVSLLLFNKGFLAFYNANLASLFAGLAEVIQYKLVSAFGMAKASAVSLAGAFTMIAPLAVITGILLLVKWIKYLGEATERQIEKVRNLKEEYDSLNKSLEENESKQQQVIDRLKELYDLRSNNKITDAEKEELTRLENVNTELERQIKYEEELKKIKGEGLERETLKLNQGKFVYSERQFDLEVTHQGVYNAPKALTFSDKILEDIEIIKDYTKEIDALKTSYDNGKISAKEYGKQLEKLTTDKNKQIESMNLLIEALKEENANYGATPEGTAKKLANEIAIKAAQDYIISLNEENEILSKLNKTTKDGAESNFNYAKSLEEVNKTIDTAQSELKDINTLIKDNGKLTAEQVLDAIQKYDLLPEHITKTTGAYKIQESALEDLRKQQIKTVEDSIQAQIDDANNVKIQTAEKLKAYGFEIQTLKDIAEAKKSATMAAHEQANKRTGGGSDAGIRDDFYRQYVVETRAYEEASKAYQDLLDKQGKYLEILNDPSLGIGDKDKGSKYDPTSEESALKSLYDAQFKSIDEYLNRLITLEKSKYSDYADKSAEQIEKMLRSRDEKIAKNTESYLSLNTTIFDTQIKHWKKQLDEQEITIDEYIKKLEEKIGKKQTDYGLGNIDLNNRPVIKNSDGSISTVRSMSFSDDSGKEILVPTVRHGLDRIMTDQEAISYYYKTGEYLGKFDTPEEAIAYAEKLHEAQEKIYSAQYTKITDEQRKTLKQELEKVKSDQITLSFDSYNAQIKSLDDSLSLLGNINTIEEKEKEAELLNKKFIITQEELKRIKKQLTDPALTDSMKELFQDKQVQLEIDIVKFKDNIEEAITEFLKLKKETALLDVEIDYTEKRKVAEESIYGKDKTQKIYEEEAQDRIDNYQNIIDILEKQADVEDEIITRKEKQKAIQEAQLSLEEAKQKLLNAQNNKSTQTYKKQDDGSWQYEYTYDYDIVKTAQEDVESAQDNLTKLREDYNKWEIDTTRKHQISLLQTQIKNEQTMIESKARNLQAQLAVLETQQKEEIKKIEEHYSNIDELIETELEELRIKSEGKWTEINTMVRGKIEEQKRLLEDLQRAIAAVAAAQATLGGMSGGGGGSIPAVRDSGGSLLHGQTAVNLSGRPEYVLDPNATKAFISFSNLLKTVDIKRMFNISTPNFNLPSKSQSSSSQIIHIDRVEFPNATNSSEIERAIKNLPMNAKVKTFAT